MNTRMLRRVRRHFSNPLAPRALNRRNMREWVRAIRVVGSRWVLAEHVAHQGKSL